MTDRTGADRPATRPRPWTEEEIHQAIATTLEITVWTHATREPDPTPPFQGGRLGSYRNPRYKMTASFGKTFDHEGSDPDETAQIATAGVRQAVANEILTALRVARLADTDDAPADPPAT